MLILFFNLILFSSSASAASSCINSTDFAEVAKSFSQYENALVPEKKQYCQEDFETVEDYKTVAALSKLKNIKYKTANYDADDGLTYQAISDKDWWSYFTKRASLMSIDRNCRTGVVAYVRLYLPGLVYLCKPFFERSLSEQASTLMHEVRHFDGFRHVECSRGLEKGTPGACDTTLDLKGAYAIGVQVLVSIALSPETPEDEKQLAEASAVYQAFNKFNKVPKLKLNEFLLLGNESGEVYKWQLFSQALTPFAQLETSARFYSSYGNFTVYPLDPRQDAYRLGPELTTNVESIGAFANYYNSLSVEERSLFKKAEYAGTGGILMGNTLYNMCDNANLTPTELNETAVSLFTIANDTLGLDQTTYLVTQDGLLVKTECEDPSNSSNIVFTPTELRVDSSAMGFIDSVSLGDKQYAILADGQFAMLGFDEANKLYYSVPMLTINRQSNTKWTALAPVMEATLFSDN